MRMMIPFLEWRPSVFDDGCILHDVEELQHVVFHGPHLPLQVLVLLVHHASSFARVVVKPEAEGEMETNVGDGKAFERPILRSVLLSGFEAGATGRTLADDVESHHTMPNAHYHQDHHRAQHVFIQVGEIGDAGQVLIDDEFEGDGSEDEREGQIQAKLRQIRLHRKRREGQRTD